MESNLTLSSIAALFGAMIVLASIPSVSVLAVSVRSATSGGNPSYPDGSSRFNDTRRMGSGARHPADYK